MTTRQIDRIVLYGGIFKKKHTPTLQEAAPGAEVIITNDLAEALAAVPEAQVYAGMSEEFTPRHCPQRKTKNGFKPFRQAWKRC